MNMQGLSPTRMQALTPTCPPGLARLGAYLLTGTLTVTLLAQGLAVAHVLYLLAAVALLTVAVTSPAPAAVLTRACAPLARHVLARAAVGA